MRKRGRGEAVMGAEERAGSHGVNRPNPAGSSGSRLTRRGFLKAGGGALAGIYALQLAGCEPQESFFTRNSCNERTT